MTHDAKPHKEQAIANMYSFSATSGDSNVALQTDSGSDSTPALTIAPTDAELKAALDALFSLGGKS